MYKPCVCGRGVSNNSIQRTSCQKWLLRICSGIKSSRYWYNISVNANLELVDKFCYLGDMLSVDGDADAAGETKIRTGWNKFRQLVPLLTNKDILLTVRRRLYSSCLQSSMLHVSETWPVRNENEVALQRAEMRMVTWMCGVKLQHKSSK